ncbi:hypothetical protein NEOLEDRAFT_713749 [Neolentinus lepideus HHB14362 ss-1]|uniref:Uncharacterized protein n=1 Tax=Neolentinus lepideus HHB14362 ss-1 TaxID=1314782 RepID=A0A165Q4H3_9AGAM|nr:hypothetical protein NEOLEDRAFT_713749 [Neolentinus lepideus HHB14362 ss-1]
MAWMPNAASYVRKPTTRKDDCATTENSRRRVPIYNTSKSKPPRMLIEAVGDGAPGCNQVASQQQDVLREVDLNEPAHVVVPQRPRQRVTSFMSLGQAARQLEGSPAQTRSRTSSVVFSRPKNEDTDAFVAPKLVRTSPIVFDTAGFMGALSTAAQTNRPLETVCDPANRYTLSVGVISRHLEVWDMDEKDSIAWPVCIRLADLLSSLHRTQPPVDFLDIECRTVAHGRKLGGSKLEYMTSNSPRSLSGSLGGASQDPNHIHVEDNWRIIDTESERVVHIAKAGTEWTLGCWISIPMRLFASAETRMFRIQVRAMMGGMKKSMVISDPLVVSVSHLRMGKKRN